MNPYHERLPHRTPLPPRVASLSQRFVRWYVRPLLSEKRIMTSREVAMLFFVYLTITAPMWFSVGMWLLYPSDAVSPLGTLLLWICVVNYFWVIKEIHLHLFQAHKDLA
ncbi:MAG: hypothetical protein ABIO72_01340 [Patescibacteria group bacterium]